MAVGAAVLPAAAGSVTVTVTYRDRQMPPPGSMLEVVVEDTARAGAPATPIARATRTLWGGPPYEVALDVDDTAIGPKARPTLRARITGDGRLLWTSTAVTPLPAGATSSVALTMSRVGAPPAGAVAPAGERPLPPGRWSGVLPAAGGAGQRWTLDIHATGGRGDPAPTGLRYELQVQPLDPPDARPVSDIGRVVPDAGRLRLVGASGEARWFMRDGDDLRPLDRAGRPVGTPQAAALSREPASPRGPMSLRLALRGEFAAGGDAPVIRLCADGRRLPVAFDGAYAALERAWQAAARPVGAPVLVEVDGTIEPRSLADPTARRDVPTVVVRRVAGAWPRESCGHPAADAELLGTTWTLVRLDGRPVDVAPGRREPHLVLQTSGDGVRVAGHTGCNRLAGGVHLGGDGELRFTAMATTRMACPDDDGAEPAFLRALSAVVAYRIAGSHLELLDPGSRPVARLEAVPLR